ncbi:MAG TPA: hypothetical protein VI233_09725 [Puia sp.]
MASKKSTNRVAQFLEYIYTLVYYNLITDAFLDRFYGMFGEDVRKVGKVTIHWAGEEHPPYNEQKIDNDKLLQLLEGQQFLISEVSRLRNELQAVEGRFAEYKKRHPSK